MQSKHRRCLKPASAGVEDGIFVRPPWADGVPLLGYPNGEHIQYHPARNNKPAGLYTRDRRGHVLLIDARKMGTLVDRTRRERPDEAATRIADTDQAWLGEQFNVGARLQAVIRKNLGDLKHGL